MHLVYLYFLEMTLLFKIINIFSIWLTSYEKSPNSLSSKLLNICNFFSSVFFINLSALLRKIFLKQKCGVTYLLSLEQEQSGKRNKNKNNIIVTLPQIFRVGYMNLLSELFFFTHSAMEVHVKSYCISQRLLLHSWVGIPYPLARQKHFLA